MLWLFWRRKWDLNPCAGFPTYSLSRGAPSPLGYFSKGCNVKYDIVSEISCFRSMWNKKIHSRPQAFHTPKAYFIYEVYFTNPRSGFISLKKQSFFMAEGKGFEPLWSCPQTVFKTASLWPLRYPSVCLHVGISLCAKDILAYRAALVKDWFFKSSVFWGFFMKKAKNSKIPLAFCFCVC